MSWQLNSLTQTLPLAVTVASVAMCITHQSTMIPISPSLKNSLMGAIQDSADFAIQIHPPEQDTNDIMYDLDEILSLEREDQNYEMEEYARAKQEMLNLHKQRIERIVSKAFEPIHAVAMHSVLP